MTAPSTPTDDDARTDADTENNTESTVSEPGIHHADRDEFETDAEQKAYGHDHVSQVREAAAGTDPRIM